MDKLPTKEQIKKAYNISEDDFNILTKFPSKEDFKKNPGFLKKLGTISGYDIWKRKSKLGKLKDILLIHATVYSAIQFYQPIVDFSYDKGMEIIQSIQWPEENQEIKTIAILPPKIKLKNTL